MYQLIIKLRNRILQLSIIGLIFLSFYAYRYTATNEIHHLATPTGGGQSARSLTRSTSNTIVNQEMQGTSSSSKNTTQEPGNLNSSHNVSNVPAITTFPSSSSSSLQQQSSPSSNISKTVEQQSSTKIVNDDSAAAIYQAGHSVTISQTCPNFGAGLELVILVMSAPNHGEGRTAIRQTWGHFSQRKDVSIAFLLGATLDAKLEQIILREQDMYGDIIRGRFVDSYSNLTLKTISALEWVKNHCSSVKFVLKTDDDMFINVPRLLSFVNKRSKDKNVIFGRLAKSWKPIRNKKSKYYVSQAQFKPAVFPDFTTGPAYLLSSDVVTKLYKASLEQTYLKLEDVFTTGIVAHKLGIRRTQANEFLNKRITFNPCNVQRSISIHMVKYSEQFDLWKKLLDGKSKCKNP